MAVEWKSKGVSPNSSVSVQSFEDGGIAISACDKAGYVARVHLYAADTAHLAEALAQHMNDVGHAAAVTKAADKLEPKPASKPDAAEAQYKAKPAPLYGYDPGHMADAMAFWFAAKKQERASGTDATAWWEAYLAALPVCIQIYGEGSSQMAVDEAARYATAAVEARRKMEGK